MNVFVLKFFSADFSQFEVLIKQLEIQSSTKYENSPIEAETERNDLGSIHDFSSVAQVSLIAFSFNFLNISYSCRLKKMDNQILNK